MLISPVPACPPQPVPRGVLFYAGWVGVAAASPNMRPLRTHEVVVLDLGVSASLSGPDREALRAARPIVVTGSADPGSRALAEDLGATDYLVKPVDMEALIAAIERRKAGRG